mgnify:CR=1 FL=1
MMNVYRNGIFGESLTSTKMILACDLTRLLCENRARAFGIILFEHVEVYFLCLFVFFEHVYLIFEVCGLFSYHIFHIHKSRQNNVEMSEYQI